MNKVFIIKGDTGGYSDRRQWLFEAYLTREAAEDRIAQIEAIFARHGLVKTSLDYHTPGWNFGEPETTDLERMKQEIGDVQFSLDYTGVAYTIETVPLVE